MKKITALLLAIITLSAVFAFSVFAAVIPGDVNGDNKKNADDAIYLLYNYYFPETYPVNQTCDFDNSGKFDANDAIYLLYNVYFGNEQYPLHSGGINTSGQDTEGEQYGPMIPLN